MFYLEFYKYKENIQKISFTRFLKEERNISLSAAKNALDKFLEGNHLVFAFISRVELQKFKRQAESYGAISKTLRIPLYLNTSRTRKPSVSKSKIVKRSSQEMKHSTAHSKELILY